MSTETTKAERQERLAADRDRRRQLRAAEDREFEARSTLRHAGFKLDPLRRFPLAILEALAGVVDEWGQDADYPGPDPELREEDIAVTVTDNHAVSREMHWCTVRATHLPTGITATAEGQSSQIAVKAAVLRDLQKRVATPAHLWPCGCLINDAGAHRAGCPDHPEGVRG